MAEVLIGQEAEGRRQKFKSSGGRKKIIFSPAPVVERLVLSLSKAEPLHPSPTSSQVNVIEDYDI
ncbi:MAG: hypothetical protein RLZZ176_922 [Cyanobacteriota bacterium]|jgi:hypothetical protein